MEGMLTLSRKEIDRLMQISQIEEENISIFETSRLLGLSQRQIYRILKRVKTEASKGIVRKFRGRKSNREYPEKLREKIIRIYRKQYFDFRS